jgi:hypothetical protein
MYKSHIETDFLLALTPCRLDLLAVVVAMDSTEQLKAWAKMIAATSAISFALGATAALVANRYTGHRDVIAPAFTNETPAFAPGFQVITSDFYHLFERGRNATERGIQICAERLHGGNDCYRDAGGDEAVFNRRRT